MSKPISNDYFLTASFIVAVSFIGTSFISIDIVCPTLLQLSPQFSLKMSFPPRYIFLRYLMQLCKQPSPRKPTFRSNHTSANTFIVSEMINLNFRTMAHAPIHVPRHVASYIEQFPKSPVRLSETYSETSFQVPESGGVQFRHDWHISSLQNPCVGIRPFLKGV